jgi:hypothetical protein
MPSRKKVIENAIKIIQKEARAQLELGVQKWNGYPIVSVQQWRKILYSENPADAAKFLPDDYTNDDIVLSFFAKGEFHTWWKNWMDFLSSRKNPTVGRRCCTDCILNYEPGPIQRYVLGELGLSGRCDIVNAFCCPNTEFGAGYLIFVGKACRIIENVLIHYTKKTACDDFASIIGNPDLFSDAFDQYCDSVENDRTGAGDNGQKKEKADKIRTMKEKVLAFVQDLDGMEPEVFVELRETFRN